jgi:putative salt-induced outer membrane protein YdiY
MELRQLLAAATMGALFCFGAAPTAAQEFSAPLLPPPSVAPEPVFAAPDADFNSPLAPDGALPAGTLKSETLEAAIAPASAWYYPSYWFGPEPWNAGLELGINGSEGNNNVLSLRTGGHLRRESKRWKLDSSLVYNKNHSNGIETQNNGKIDFRLDRILAESPWTLFTLDNLIYDEFQPFDLQLSLNVGVGYRVVHTELVNLLTRFGAGTTRDFGGVDDEWKPQALFGLDYEEKISKMQRIVAKVDYYPEWEDFRRYRVVTDLGWQIDLDRPKNVSLKLSLIDRYDSTPGGAVPNNLDYAVLLIWGL